jgi:uncharacterized protein YkwD
MPLKNKCLTITTFVSVLLVSACGSSVSDPSNDPSSDPVGSAPDSGGQGATAPATNLNSFQADLLQRVNVIRAQGANCGGQTMAPTGDLQWNNLVEQAAAGHSEYMKSSESFSHTGANGSSVGDRLTATGYTWQTVGENIAAGYPDAASVVQGWLTSAGHCRNMLNANFTQLGVALVDGDAGSAYNSYWTMVLARPL